LNLGGEVYGVASSALSRHILYEYLSQTNNTSGNEQALGRMNIKYRKRKQKRYVQMVR